MSTAKQSSTSASRLAIFSQGFRPFFFGAAIWAVMAIAIWIAMLRTGMTLPSRFDSLTWHMHEMLFGFVMAAIAGFLLTAIPNWTKRLPISGAPLAGLAGLWLAGRVACLLSALMPIWLAVGLDLAFPAALVAAAAREIVAGRNWRNLVILDSRNHPRYRRSINAPGSQRSVDCYGVGLALGARSRRRAHFIDRWAYNSQFLAQLVGKRERYSPSRAGRTS